jgi:hypothetical protein
VQFSFLAQKEMIADESVERVFRSKSGSVIFILRSRAATKPIALLVPPGYGICNHTAKLMHQLGLSPSWYGHNR